MEPIDEPDAMECVEVGQGGLHHPPNRRAIMEEPCCSVRVGEDSEGRRRNIADGERRWGDSGCLWLRRGTGEGLRE